jgi:hypothetical protein
MPPSTAPLLNFNGQRLTPGMIKERRDQRIRIGISAYRDPLPFLLDASKSTGELAQSDI